MRRTRRVEVFPPKEVWKEASALHSAIPKDWEIPLIRLAKHIGTLIDMERVYGEGLLERMEQRYTVVPPDTRR